MIKNYIIDTNILLQDPNSLFNFKDNNVIIPLGVIEELDKFKKDVSELGRNARTVTRSLDSLREHGTLTKGVPIGKQGGKLRVFANGDLEKTNKKKTDIQILDVAHQISQKDKNIPTIIVTRDINIRLRADALGLRAENYKSNKVDLDNLFKGHGKLLLSKDAFDEFEQGEYFVDIDASEFFPNQYLLVRQDDNLKRSMLARVDGKENSLVKLPSLPEGLSIKPMAMEQSFVLDALLNPKIDLVCIVGRSGTGKSLCSVAAGYHQVFNRHDYSKMLISRPTVPMGRDIGYLPGTLEEKLDPWMQPIYDALEIVCNKGKSVRNGRDGKDVFEQTRGNIKIEPLSYIRGRSIHDQFVVIDECQNLVPLEVKTIVTRAGQGTKVVLTGDIDQIDNPYIDSRTNGLTVALEAFKYSKIAAHIILSKGIRSALAEEASKVM